MFIAVVVVHLINKDLEAIRPNPPSVGATSAGEVGLTFGVSMMVVVTRRGRGGMARRGVVVNSEEVEY